MADDLGVPVATSAGEIDEVFQNTGPVRGVAHLRMKLQTDKTAFAIGHGGNFRRLSLARAVNPDGIACTRSP